MANHKDKKEALYLGEILIRNGWLSWEQLDEVLKIQRASGRILGDILLEGRFVKKADLYKALAIQYGTTFVDFSKIRVPDEVVKIIPKQVAYQHKVMPLVVQGGKLLVATSNPMNAWAESEVHDLAADYEVLTVIATPEDIQSAIERYYGPENA